MKIKTYMIIPISWLTVLVACSGDHSANGGKDTAKQHFDAPSAIDTSKAITPGADASLDNSASGGTKIAKDSTQFKNNKKK